MDTITGDPRTTLLWCIFVLRAIVGERACGEGVVLQANPVSAMMGRAFSLFTLPKRVSQCSDFLRWLQAKKSIVL